MKKIFLLIQGHTKYCDKVLENVKDVENVIWSTENCMPAGDLEKIAINMTLTIEFIKWLIASTRTNAFR